MFVAGGLPPAPATAGTNDNAGTVEFASYAPKDIVLKSDAPAPSVLLLNDRFDPNWKVRVDGKPETLLRCNYIMRGVYLPPGAHTVEFRFQPPLGPLYVSLAAIGVGLLVLGFVVMAGRRDDSLIPAPTSPPQPGQSRPGCRNGAPASGTFEPSPQPAIAHCSSAGTGREKRARKARVSSGSSIRAGMRVNRVWAGS